MCNMSSWCCYTVLIALLLGTSVSDDETEICIQVTAKCQPLQHSSAFIKDESGNAAEIKRVTLIEQTSTSPCVRWETFAHYGSSLVVKDGCQGRFNVCYTAGVRTPSVPLTELIDCVTVRLLSQMHEPAEKIIARSDGRGDLIVSMTLLQSFSAVSCVPGLTYNYYGHKVDARYGCKGEFRVCIDPLIILEPAMPVSDFMVTPGSRS